MEKRRIGSLEVSVVGLGCNNFGRRLDEAGTNTVVAAALEAGVTFFDTADVYGEGQSEILLGKALGARRKDVVIATKFGMAWQDGKQGGRPEYVKQAVEDSLKRLGTDRIDLYQLHTPDKDVPVTDTLGALDDLVKAGKVREIGCSNFDVDQLSAAMRAPRTGGARFVCVQNEYSLLRREAERDVLPYCASTGLSFLPYFPLASGLLTGKVRKGEPPAGSRLATSPSAGKWLTEANLEHVERLKAFCASRGRTLLELAFAWLLARPSVSSVIAGATTGEQVAANVRARRWKLTPDEIEAVTAIAAPAETEPSLG